MSPSTRLTTRAALGLLTLAACSPAQRIDSIPGFSPFGGEFPEPTQDGDGPEITVANLVTGEPGYFEFHIDGSTSATHLLLAADDHVYAANLDDLEVTDLCEWVEREQAGAYGPYGGAFSSCSAECADACSCIGGCAQLPTDLGLIGSPAALCTLSCSQADGSIDPVEFADIFDEVYGCHANTCSGRRQWFGMIEVNYPSIGNETLTAAAVSAPDTPWLSSDSIGAATVGDRVSCIVY